MKYYLFLIMSLGMNISAAQVASGEQLIRPAYKLHTSQTMDSCIEFVAQQRMEAFREYPYLYAGTKEGEKEYLQQIMQSEHSVVIVAYHEARPIGFISGTSLTNFDAHAPGISDLFKANKLEPSTYYYIAECIVVPQYRGNRAVGPVYQVLGEMLGQYAQQAGYTNVCFLTVQREDSHPQKPVNYRPLDTLCMRHGIIKTALTWNLSWDTIQTDGTAVTQNNELIIWTKSLQKSE